MELNIKTNEKTSGRYSFLICLCLIVGIIAVYWPVYSFDFVKYDDDTYVTNNINIQPGLTWQSIGWAFTTDYAGNWHPLTWISLALDRELFNDWAGGYHLTNILFHILNTLILFYVLMQMTGAIWPSAFVAAAFALHPLHIESVAWIAERKDLLSTFFWLLTMWAYIRYVKNPKLNWYPAALFLFVLGLMAKPMLVTLPFVLLLLDFWPLERKISYKLLVEKIPFFIFSLISSVITFFIQQGSGAMIAADVLKLKIRVGNAIISYLAYIVKMIWPSRLAVLYPHHGDDLSMTTAVISGLLLVLISIYFIYLARRRRFFAVGWLWYLGTLVPVIGFVQVGVQAMADRYTYITLTGLFIIIAWSAKEFIPKWRYRNIVLALLAVATLSAWAVIARQQIRYWKNSLTLFEHTLQVTEKNILILANYATYLSEHGRFDEAIEQSNKFLKMRPNTAEAQNNLGNILLRAGRADEAVEHLKLAVKYNPDFPQAIFNLASALKKQGKPQDAVFYYKQVLKIRPNDIETCLDIAVIFYELKEFDRTIEFCDKAFKISPGNVLAHGNRGMALAAIGKTDEAIKEISLVLAVRPNDAEMHRNLGILFERKGDIAKAVEEYRTASRIDPNDAVSKQFFEDALKEQKDRQNGPK